MNNIQITKRMTILITMFLGLLAIPAANADVVVRYVVVDDGYSYREPFSSRQGSRIYSNSSRSRNITYSNGSRYNNRCEDDRYYKTRQYRNNYYYGHQNRYRNYDRRNRSDYQRRGNSRNYGYHRERYSDRNNAHEYHGYYRSPTYPDKRMHNGKNGRVHIKIK